MDYISKGQFPPEKGRSTTPQPPTQYSTPAPHSSQYPPHMNPRLSPPRYDTSTSRSSSPQPVGPNGTLVLVDRDDGYQVGALDGNLNTAGVVPGSHEPVEIDLTRPDGVVTVRTVNADYLKDSQHPAYANSRLVSTAATASRTLVAGASLLANAMTSGAKTFTEKTTPNVVPMTFDPTTHNRVRTIHNATTSTAQLSSQTIGKISNYTQNFGARLAGKNEDRPPKQTPDKPGYFNKGVIAFSTIADSIDHATRLILTSGSQAATQMVAHKYGAEAGEVARGLTGAVKNVGLVYIDASGVSRRAVVKSVAKGMVVGKVRGGGEVVFDGENQSTGALHPQGTGMAQQQPPPPQYQQQQQQQHLYSPQPQHVYDAGGIHRANTFPAPHPVGRQDSGLSQYTSYTGHSQSGRTTPTTAMGFVSPQPTGGTYASAQAYQEQQQQGGYGGEKQGGQQQQQQFRY